MGDEVQVERPDGHDEDDPLVSNDYDLSLIRSNLLLTYAERAERHYHARQFAQRMRELGRRARGPAADDPEEAA